MNLFNKLPGFVCSPNGLEQVILRRLPRIALFGTLLPLCLTFINRELRELRLFPVNAENATTLFDFIMAGCLWVHWMLLVALGLGCFIVYVMKGPAYVADAYSLPDEEASFSKLETEIQRDYGNVDCPDEE